MRTMLAVLAALALMACEGPLPAPVTPNDSDFVIAPRPPCSEAVRAILMSVDLDAIRRGAEEGAQFTCGPLGEPTPLSRAIRNDSLVHVRALLDAGADPNARWLGSGDRHPLHDAVGEQPRWPTPTDAVKIAQLLLQYGADPDARVCPFESRHSGLPRGCSAPEGITPLLAATWLDRADLVYVLLDGGSNPFLEDWWGRSPLDVAGSAAVMALLTAAMFRDPATRDADALAYLDGRHITWLSPQPWYETAITSRIAGGPVGPGPPPAHWPRFYRPDERFQMLIHMGADTNRRLTWQGVDWTPLALAVSLSQPSRLKTLLENGADPNGRWCVGFEFWRQPGGRTSAPGCTVQNGFTPLMAAASDGSLDQVLLLLEHGADAGLRDWRGRTAVEYAEGGNTAVIRTLRAAAAADGGARYRGSS